MDKVERIKRDLVIANRILAAEGVLDAYGHVSARHPEKPDQFFMSHSLSPELVDIPDILTLDSQGAVIDDSRHPALERFIHAAVYAQQPAINFVVHGHSEAVLPFSITDTPLIPVINVAADMGAHVPVWDIADAFGDSTNTLVTNLAQGLSLAATLGDSKVVLMRGHGFTAASASIVQLVRMAVYLPRNARVQLEAMRIGVVKPIKSGEIAQFAKMDPESPASMRGWRYWAKKCGCEDLLGDGSAPRFVAH